MNFEAQRDCQIAQFCSHLTDDEQRMLNREKGRSFSLKV
jgi:hypothetical protein